MRSSMHLPKATAIEEEGNLDDREDKHMRSSMHLVEAANLEDKKRLDDCEHNNHAEANNKDDEASIEDREDKNLRISMQHAQATEVAVGKPGDELVVEETCLNVEIHHEGCILHVA